MSRFPRLSVPPGAVFRALCLMLFLSLIPGAVSAQVRSLHFAAEEGFVLSPERGFWISEHEDFLRSDNWTYEWMARQRNENGYSVAFALIRLDDWRDAPLPEWELNWIEGALGNARRAGIKLILRFSYNYGDGQPDAPLWRVLQHIRQLGPVLRRNRDTLAVIQAGFIGQWGEGHGSTNGLDSPASKAAIRDALLEHFPLEVPLQWRRPPDLMAWGAEGRGRFGFHNDCFLSAPDDTGTYTGWAGQQLAQRLFAQDLTESTPFTVQTCRGSAPRLGCWAILEEGALYHLNTLDAAYHPDFHARWRAEGCRDAVERRLGYRLRMAFARIDQAAHEVTVWVANDGWSRIFSPRPLLATQYRGGTPLETITLGPAALLGRETPAGGQRLGDVAPGETLPFQGRFRRWILRNDVVCLSSPDPRQPDLGAYAVRFANAAVPGQSWWSDARAAFCFNAVP